MSSVDHKFDESLLNSGSASSPGSRVRFLLGPSCPTGEDLRERGRNLRKMQAAYFVHLYGMPEGTTMEEAFAEHHRRRCEKLGVPVETSKHALLLLELGYPRDEVLKRDRQGFWKSETDTAL